MKYFEIDDLQELIEHKEKPSISLYLPMHATGDGIRQDSIRIRKKLDQCQDYLRKQLSPRTVEKILEPARDFSELPDYEKHQGPGIAMFISPSFARFFHLSFEVSEKLYFGEYFYILELLDKLKYYNSFYVAALSLKENKLFKANYHKIEEIAVKDIPQGINDFLKFDVTEEHIQMHASPIRSTVGTDANFHGQGNIADEAQKKKNIGRFYKEVSSGFDKQLGNDKAPLILAGVQYDKTQFKENCDYKNILEESINIENGTINPNQLHEKARELALGYFDKKSEDCLETYQNQLGNDISESDPREIISGAYTGKVDTLLTDVNQTIWGKFDENSINVDIHDNYIEDDEDVVNLAAIYAMKTNANICTVDSKKINIPLAAILRY